MKQWTDDESRDLDRANKRLQALRERSIRDGMPQSKQRPTPGQTKKEKR